MNILSLITTKRIGVVALLLLLGYVHLLKLNLTQEIAERERNESNYLNALKIDSLEHRIFRIKSESELEQLLETNQGLNDLVQKSKIKTSRIQKLYYQQQNYIDSIKSKSDVSNLVDKVRKDIPAVLQWKDTTGCVKVYGDVEYKNDSLSVHVNKKVSQEEVAIIHSKGRRKRVKWLFGLRLGARTNEFTTEAKCSKVKVTVIDKEK